MRVVITSLAGLLAVSAAHAQDAEPARWTVGVSGGASSAEDSRQDPSSDFAGLSLDWRGDGFSVGGSLSHLRTDNVYPELTTPAEATGVQASAWIAWPAGPVDLDASVTASTQDIEGQIVATGASAPAFAGEKAAIAGTVRSYGASFGASWPILLGSGAISPHARLSYDVSENAATATIRNLVIDFGEDASGVTGSLGLSGDITPADPITLFADVSGFASSNAAASALSASSRRGVSDPVGGSGSDSANWLEASAGMTLRAGQRTAFTLSGGRTFGLDLDTVFASAGVSVDF